MPVKCIDIGVGGGGGPFGVQRENRGKFLYSKEVGSINSKGRKFREVRK